MDTARGMRYTVPIRILKLKGETRMAWLQVNFQSNSLLRNTALHIVVPAEAPPGAPPRPIAPFKTLYLLHGLMGDAADWLVNAQIAELAQQFNLAVVMPSGDNSFYMDHASSTEQYSAFIGKEVVEFTRALLPLSRKREDTLIGGLSMGGYGALYNGLRWNETFGHVIALSSALIMETAANLRDAPDPLGLNRAYYETIFGDLAAYPASERHLYNLAQKVRDGGTPPDLYFACGWNDVLVHDNRKFAKRLETIGLPHTYEEGAGTHEWAFWNAYLRRGLARLYPVPEADTRLSPFWIDKPAD
jgi:S-formylglutathione hydrolase FrmB